MKSTSSNVCMIINYFLFLFFCCCFLYNNITMNGRMYAMQLYPLQYCAYKCFIEWMSFLTYKIKLWIYSFACLHNWFLVQVETSDVLLLVFFFRFLLMSTASRLWMWDSSSVCWLHGDDQFVMRVPLKPFDIAVKVTSQVCSDRHRRHRCRGSIR